MSRPVAALTVATFLAMGAGFLREVTIAYHFGTSASADALALALFYADGIAAVVIVGLAGYTLVPVVTGVIAADGHAAAYRLLESLLLWTALLSLPIVVAAWLAPARIAELVAPEFAPEQRDALIALVRSVVPACALLLMTGAMAGVLQAGAAYNAPVFGRAALSLVTAGALVGGTRALGVRAGGLGLLCGAAAQLLWLGEALRRGGWRPRPPRLNHPALARAVAAGLPTLLALLLTNILMGGAQRFIASGLPEGGFAALNYAQRAVNLVSGFTMAIATVALTELSVEFHATGIGARMQRIIRDGLDTGLFIVIPLSVLLVLLSEPLIALLFQRGQYPPESLDLTAQCLRWLAASIAPGLVVAILHRACPACGRPWRATAVSLLWVAVTILTTVWLLPAMGAVALAAGFTLGMTAAAVGSVIALRDLLAATVLQSVATGSLRASGLTAVALLPAAGLTAMLQPNDGLWTAGRGLVVSMVATATFVTLFVSGCLLVGEPRWRRLADGVRRMIRERRGAAELGG
jgi:putative peptidoglycan lipid II flippase